MIVGKWNKSVILTYAGLILAILGMVLAFTTERISYSFCCLMLAGVCDLFDGTVARRCKRTEEEKMFGIELDSLVDTISFIALPVCIFISIGLTHVWDIIILMIYAVAGVARLAYFNIDTADSEGPVKYYLGLPVTYTALIFPVIYLFRLVLEDNIFLPVYTCGIVVVSVLEVLKVKMPKPRGIWYGIFGVFAIAMLAVFLVFV